VDPIECYKHTILPLAEGHPRGSFGTGTLTVTPTSSVRIDKKTIVEAYVDKLNCGSLCDDLIRATLMAINYKALQRSGYRMADELKKSIPGFASNLEARLKQPQS